MTTVLLTGGFVLAGALGWVAGMCTSDRSRRWCPRCGRTLRCACSRVMP